MRRLNKRERILIISFFIVFLFYVVSNYFIQPVMQNIEMLETELAQLKAEWDEMKTWVGQETKLKDKISTLENEVNQEMEKVAPVNQSALYWNVFNKIAGETGSMIIRMDEGKDIPAAGKIRVFTLGISGSESNVQAFINRMNSMNYVTAVQKGTFDYQDNSSVMGTMELLVGSR